MKYKILTINTDGGARGNPGPAAIGVFASSNSETIFTISEYIGQTTNNVAEYTAVIKALEYLQEKKIAAEKIDFVLDSELVVKQLIGVYKIKQPHLQQLAQTIHKLLSQTNAQINFSHVRRAFNKQADLLVNQSLDARI